MVWVAARANGGHAPAYLGVLGKDLAAALDTTLGTLNGRGNRFLQAIDAYPEWGAIRLGSVDLLTGRTRRELAEHRVELAALEERGWPR